MKTLFTYQKTPHKRILRALQKVGRALLVMAPGLGKTIVSAHIVQHFVDRGERILFLYCENEGLKQGENKYRQVLGNHLDYAQFYGTKEKNWKADQAQIVFASFQSMNSSSGKWFEVFNKDHFDLVIVDEAHHAGAPTYREVIDWFDAKKLGMTATPDREDDTDIRDIFGDEVVNISLAKGIANGWLADVEYHVLSDGISTSKLKKIMKEVDAGEARVTVKQLNETIFVSRRNYKQKNLIKDYSTITQYAHKKKTLIFCERIEHAERFAECFRRDEVGVVHSKRRVDDNADTLERFRNGEIQYLVAVDKLNECIDVPDVEVVVFLRATDSKRIFIQQFGRGARKTALKDKLIVLDFVGNCERLIMLRELQKRIREESNLINPDQEFNTNIFNLKGKYYDLSFTDRTIQDVLNLLDAIDEGFYTYDEAKGVLKTLRITRAEEYFHRRKEDLRLPGCPRTYYQRRNVWISYNDFLGKEGAPKGWITANNISDLEGIVGGREKVKTIAEEYREKHPEWFGEYCTRVWYIEHYHPKLVAILKERCAQKEKAPEGWMTVSAILQLEVLSVIAEKKSKPSPKSTERNIQSGLVNIGLIEIFLQNTITPGS